MKACLVTETDQRYDPARSRKNNDSPVEHPGMLRRHALTLLIVFSLCALVALAAIGIDRSQTIKWIGGTTLDVDFLVSAEESGQPIPDARIELRSHGGFYDGGDKDEGLFEVRTDASGMARRQCRNNRCIGTQSRLLFTDTRHVYI